MAAKKRTWPKLSRDTVLMLAGLAGIANETLVESGERPTLLLLFAAMVGLPAFLRTDEAVKARGVAKDKEQEES